MDKASGILQIKKACDSISAELLKIHPAVAALGDKSAQDDIIKALFQLTKELETIKKRTLKVERQEDTPQL